MSEPQRESRRPRTGWGKRLGTVLDFVITVALATAASVYVCIKLAGATFSWGYVACTAVLIGVVYLVAAWLKRIREGRRERRSAE